MRKPHVQSLHYVVSSEEGISYKDPEQISFSNYLGTFELNEGWLQIIPTEHFSDEKEARQAVEPFLLSWEIEADLTSNIGEIRFEFDYADIIDLDPPPPDSPRVIQAETGSLLLLGGDVSFHLTRNKYPQPPKGFQATPEVQVAYRRWLGFRQGKEPLQSMAYFVLTLLESVAGSREAVASILKIDRAVLSKIGKLSSTKGDESTARKAKMGNKYQELTGSEKRWLEVATRRVIFRLGEHASGTPLAQLSLSDLPKL